VRASELFIPTLREDPADAEAASHRLLLRGAFIRQVGAGLYSFLPLGWRVHQQVVQIIREEMNAIGGQEMLMPLLTPAELWQKSERYAYPEVYKLADRGERPFVLALSHEETITLHATEIRSYKELPQIWYHFGNKARDEPRPRGGLLRVREFVMKDSYSFDRDEEGLDESYGKHARAYRAIFERCGLEFHEVESDVGQMGGSGAHEYLAPSEAGENELALCGACGYAANVEVATSRPTPIAATTALSAPEEVETPGARTVEEVAEYLGVEPARILKTVAVIVPERGLVLAVLRGDERLHELKLAKALGAEFRPARPEEILEAFGAEPGSIGPVGAAADVIADEAVRGGSWIAGANRTGYHLKGVEAERDFTPFAWADLRTVVQGDACPRCGTPLRVEPAIEVGNIFKLGTRYSVPLGASYLDEEGSENPIVMGSYGIGPARTMAAIIEQHHDEHGIAWPRTVTPFDVEVVVIGSAGSEAVDAAEGLAGDLEQAGLAVLLDDRDRRPGEKFADADLIGCPVRITVGKKTLEDGQVDVLDRVTREEDRVSIAQAAARVGSLV
jgi:prolyl-tRNA synthetase